MNKIGNLPSKKNRTVMYGLTYRLRKKGFRVISRKRTIIAEYLSNPMEVRQIRRLVREYNFSVQFQFE
jgi:hypothetical protein